jgi:hypothetical protein
MAIDDRYEPRVVKSVAPMDAVLATRTSDNKQEQRQKKEPHTPKKVRDYFHPLSKAVENSNRQLALKQLPYRFKVFKRWGEVYIELCTLNIDGSIRHKEQKNISHDDFNRIIDDVVSIEGLFFDRHA